MCAAWRPRATVAPAADRRRGWATGTSTWARAGTGAPSRGSSPPPASSSAPGGSASLTFLSPHPLPSLALAFHIWSIECDLRRLRGCAAATASEPAASGGGRGCGCWQIDVACRVNMESRRCETAGRSCRRPRHGSSRLMINSAGHLSVYDFDIGAETLELNSYRFSIRCAREVVALPRFSDYRLAFCSLQPLLA